jgi:hypothetical protein
MQFTETSENLKITKFYVLFLGFSVKVDEISKNISLSVIRTQGTFGNVSVFYYAQSIVEGTTQGLDYAVTPQVKSCEIPVS